jgi:hypothetical protein
MGSADLFSSNVLGKVLLAKVCITAWQVGLPINNSVSKMPLNPAGI